MAIFPSVIFCYGIFSKNLKHILTFDVKICVGGDIHPCIIKLYKRKQNTRE